MFVYNQMFQTKVITDVFTTFFAERNDEDKDYNSADDEDSDEVSDDSEESDSDEEGKYFFRIDQK